MSLPPSKRIMLAYFVPIRLQTSSNGQRFCRRDSFEASARRPWLDSPESRAPDSGESGYAARARHSTPADLLSEG